MEFMVGKTKKESRRGIMWTWGCVPCWQVHTNKTREMPFIPAKPNVARPCRGSWLIPSSAGAEKRIPEAFKLGNTS